MVLDNPLARSVLEAGQKEEFRGTMLELAKHIGWGTGSKELGEMGKQLRYLAPVLEEAGVAVSFLRSNGQTPGCGFSAQ